jgi:hypothetical protein
VGYLARNALNRGDFVESTSLAETAVEMAAANDDLKGMAIWRAFLGYIQLFTDNLVEARRLLEQAWAEGCTWGRPFTRQIPAIFLTELALREGNLDAARGWLAESMSLSTGSSRDLDWRHIHRSMLAAWSAAREGRDSRAAQLYGFMHAYNDRVKTGPKGPVIDTAAPIMTDVRARLGDAKYQSAYEIGRLLPVDETLANLLAKDC